MTATRTTKAQLLVQIAALEARLAIGHSVCRAQRTRIAELEARIATPGVKSAPAPLARAVTDAHPVTTMYYDRAGNLWQKTRLGNKATSRILLSAELVADFAARDAAASAIEAAEYAAECAA